MKTWLGETFAIVLFLAFIAAAWLAGDWLADVLHMHMHLHPLPGWITFVLFFAVCGLWGYALDLRKRVDVLESRIDQQWREVRELRDEDWPRTRHD